MSLTLIRDSSPQTFLEKTESLLCRDEPMNSLMLGLCANLLSAPTKPPKQSPVLIRLLRNGTTATAAFQAPPFNLVLTYAKPDELELLAKYLREINATFPGVVGPAKEAENFAAIWTNLTDKKIKSAIGQKLYRIEKVILPEVAGSMRPARLNEIDFIARWLEAFVDEAIPFERTSFEERKHQALRGIENQRVYVWTVKNEVVSMAHVGRPTKNGISVFGVYTPKQFRKNGYASAVTAHVSQKMLNSGKKFCVLYTDLANPTSNRIYQDIGYQEVADSKYFLFED